MNHAIEEPLESYNYLLNHVSFILFTLSLNVFYVYYFGWNAQSKSLSYEEEGKV